MNIYNHSGWDAGIRLATLAPLASFIKSDTSETSHICEGRALVSVI